MQIPEHLESEANIQAEFYGVCKQVGLNCALEVSTPLGRLDVAIFYAALFVVLAFDNCQQSLFANSALQKAGRSGFMGSPEWTGLAWR